jgi:hypothetical protein
MMTRIDQLLKDKGKAGSPMDGDDTYEVSASDFDRIKRQYRPKEIRRSGMDVLVEIGERQTIRIESSLSKSGYVRVFAE